MSRCTRSPKCWKIHLKNLMIPAKLPYISDHMTLNMSKDTLKKCYTPCKARMLTQWKINVSALITKECPDTVEHAIFPFLFIKTILLRVVSYVWWWVLRQNTITQPPARVTGSDAQFTWACCCGQWELISNGFRMSRVDLCAKKHKCQEIG